MSHYGIILSQFWRGETGRDIRTHGGKDAQLAALYLMSCENATMIGLYPLPVKTIKTDTGIGIKGLVRAFKVLGAVGYALYDARTEHVWVCEMAKFRLALDRASLKPADNRVLGAQRLYEKLIENPFLEPFFDRYAKELHLKAKRRCARRAEPLLDVADPSKTKGGLLRGLKGLRKPVNRSEISTEIRDQVQGSEIREQESGTGIRKSTAAPRRPVDNAVENSNARTSTPDADVPPSVRHREGTVQPDDHRRGVEGTHPRTLGPIGFHGTGSDDAQSRAVGGGTSDRETGRAEADPDATNAAAVPAVTATTQPGGSASSAPEDSPGHRALAEAKARILALPRLASKRGKRSEHGAS